MLYSFAKIICRFCIKIFYGNIEVSGLDRLPKDIPLLLACNHPTGFLEPIIIACVLDRELHFITRGDLFSNKALNPILRGTNQIPIWRFKDGISGLRQNKKSIDMAEEALKGGGALLMFVEGRTEDIKMLKPLQKGMARISTSLWGQNLDHRIIPVGINFIDTVTWRSRVMLNFGETINSKPILDTYSDTRQSYKEINSVISKGMKKTMLDCPDRRLHPVHNKLINVYQATVMRSFAPVIDKSQSNYSGFKKISDGFVKLQLDKQSEVIKILGEIDLSGKNKSALQKQDPSFMKRVQLFLLSPFALLGLIANVLPVLLGFTIERTFVDSREFIAPIRFAASMGLGLIYYVSILVVCISIFGLKGLLALVGLLLGWVFLYWVHLYRNFGKKYRLSVETIDRLIPIFTLLKNVR